MYHAPVPLDADPESEGPAEEGVEALAFDGASERLREAHLHNRQVEARGLFAPFFGVTAVAAALITAWSMYRSVRLALVVGWGAPVPFAHWPPPRRPLEIGRAWWRGRGVISGGAGSLKKKKYKKTNL